MLGIGLGMTSRGTLQRSATPPWVYAGSILDLDFINQRYWWNGAVRTTASFTTYALSGSTFGATGLSMTDTIDVTIALSGVGTVLPGAFAYSATNTTPPSVEGFFSLDNGTANDRINALQNTNLTAQVQAVAGGAVSANIPSAVLVAKQGVAMSYATNDFKASVNGGALTPDVSGTLPTLTTLRMGKYIGGNGSARGALGRLILFAVTKTQSELNALSTAMQSFS